MDDPSRNCNAVMEILKPCLNQLSLEPNMKPLDLIRSVLRQCIKYYPDYNVVIIKKGQVFYIPDKIDGLIYQEIHTFKRKAFGVKIANIANIAITYELQILIFKSGSLTVLCDPLKGSKWGIRFFK